MLERNSCARERFCFLLSVDYNSDWLVFRCLRKIMWDGMIYWMGITFVPLVDCNSGRLDLVV